MTHIYREQSTLKNWSELDIFGVFGMVWWRLSDDLVMMGQFDQDPVPLKPIFLPAHSSIALKIIHHTITLTHLQVCMGPLIL